MTGTVAVAVIQADNVTQILRKEMAPGVLDNLDDFLNAVQKDVNFKPFGDLLHSYKIYAGNSTKVLTKFLSKCVCI